MLLDPKPNSPEPLREMDTLDMLSALQSGRSVYESRTMLDGLGTVVWLPMTKGFEASGTSPTPPVDSSLVIAPSFSICGTRVKRLPETSIAGLPGEYVVPSKAILDGYMDRTWLPIKVIRSVLEDGIETILVLVFSSLLWSLPWGPLLPSAL